MSSLNLPKPPTVKSAPETVEEITTHPELGLLAPPTEVGQTTKPKSTIALLLETMLKDETARKESAADEADVQTAILPALLATEEALVPNLH